MLRELRIENLVLIESARLEFQSGFIALTGETGAGKSILLGALKIILGAKVKTDLIRQGAERLRVEATFEMPGAGEKEEAGTAAPPGSANPTFSGPAFGGAAAGSRVSANPAPGSEVSPKPEAPSRKLKDLAALLQRLEIEDEGELVLEREFSASGRNRCRMNGRVVTLNDLEEAGSLLVDLHGQHSQQSLLHPQTHIDLLDAYARQEEKVAAYQAVYREWRDLGSRLKKLEEEARRLKEQFDFLSFQHKELDKARLSPGEEEKMEAELKLQAGLEKVTQGLQASSDILEGEDGGILPSLLRLQRELVGLSRHLPQGPFGRLSETLETARSLLLGLRQELNHFTLPDSADPQKLDAMNARLALLQRLKSKYQADLAGLLELRDRRARELQSFQNSDAEAKGLREAQGEAAKKLLVLAGGLSEGRKEAAKRFDAEVNARLASLGMEGARFKTRLSREEPASGSTGPGPAEGEGSGSKETGASGQKETGAFGQKETGAFGPKGLDRVEFFLSANPGEEERPLKQVASGGEVSRIMLSIKTALSACDPKPLLVFDEIDTGIGGTTANRVGQALKELSEHHQLLVITHLHQIAALASSQHKVIKTAEDGRTFASVRPLLGKDRVQELARMMGDESSSATLKHARELLAQQD